MRVGILALQGAFLEHREIMEKLGCETVEVRKPGQLEGIQAIIIPGGESTTMGRILLEQGMLAPLAEMGRAGVPIYGTCAGMVLLAKEIIGSQQPRLGLMDMVVRRNAYGRQVDSFEADIEVPVLGREPLRGVFIRAPRVETVGPGVVVLASYDGWPVLVREKNLLASAFHPELTTDLRLHRHFLDEVITG
ncbi:MAG: pyridoxal 5'-phosphate synthase glutaminase subunit PdxT [Clostridia bacterium]|nr:MAG: pyridoxal 5'-phosphate synthase glutaminase subunit PdxT [Clostridia bacterium]